MGEAVQIQDMIPVEVAVAFPEHQELIALTVRKGSTAREAVAASGLLEKYASRFQDAPALGIFSRPLNGIVLPKPEEYVLKAHDRVEIYRALATDPKQARLERAARSRQDEKKGKVKK